MRLIVLGENICLQSFSVCQMVALHFQRGQANLENEEAGTDYSEQRGLNPL